MLPISLAGMVSVKGHAKQVLAQRELRMQKSRAANGEGSAVEFALRDNHETMTQEERKAYNMRSSMDDNRRAMAISSIEGRMMSGRRLSREEIAFLRENAPHLYEKANKIERERRDYQRQLRLARSRRSVANIHQHRMKRFFGEATAVARSGKSQGDRASAMQSIHMRKAAVNDEHNTFRNSLAYRRLPERCRGTGRNTREQNSITAAIADHIARNDPRGNINS